MDRRVYENAITGNIQDIMALRSMGARLEWTDCEGKTPLILVCQRHDRFDVAKILVDLGANVNAYRHGRNGGTPLHHAVMKGLDQTIKLLLENGANPFVKNDDGYTVLDLARKRGRFIIVRAIEAEAACIPCGHMAGCLTCLKMIETKNRQCPVCRAKIDQVVKIYAI